MFMKSEKRRRVVAEYIGIEHVQLVTVCRGDHFWLLGSAEDAADSFTAAHLTGASMASRLRSSQKSMNSPRRAAIAVSDGIPTVMCNVNIRAPV